MMRFKSLDEVLGYAIARETEARDFYAKLAAWVERPEVAEMFEGFVVDSHDTRNCFGRIVRRLSRFAKRDDATINRRDIQPTAGRRHAVENGRAVKLVASKFSTACC